MATIQEMHIELMQALDKVSSGSYPELLVEQRDYFLNEAIVRFVKQRYRDFEVIQKRIDDLRTLVVTEYPSVNLHLLEDNTYRVELSVMFTNEIHTILSTNKYWFYIRSRAKIEKQGCGSKYVNVKIYRQDFINDVLKDPFKRPNSSEIVGYFEGNHIMMVCPQGYTISKVKLTYLRKPVEVKYGSIYPIPTMDVDCDLPEHTHKEIIQEAVSIILENIESQRLKSSLLMKQTVE